MRASTRDRVFVYLLFGAGRDGYPLAPLWPAPRLFQVPELLGSEFPIPELLRSELSIPELLRSELSIPELLCSELSIPELLRSELSIPELLRSELFWFPSLTAWGFFWFSLSCVSRILVALLEGFSICRRPFFEVS